MGKRSRQRSRRQPEPQAPTADYADADGNVLILRGVLTPGTRREYAAALSGSGAQGARGREDARQRAAELLFERLAVRWEVAGLPIERQQELLGRFRMASVAERSWIRDVLRRHCAEHFPEIEAP
jgi:hypothetical protein